MQEELRWAMKNSTPQTKQAILRLVGLRLNPRFVKAGLEGQVLVRLNNLRGSQRWQLVRLISIPCLQEFEKELGLAYADPSEMDLRAALPRIETRCGRNLAGLTLLDAIQNGARASAYIVNILSDSQLGAADDEAVIAENVRPSDKEEPLPTPPKQRGVESVVTESASKRSEHYNFYPVARMLERVENSKFDSDATYYGNLLLLGEMVTKLVALSLVACVDREKDDALTAYAKNHELIRADGIGVWSRVIQDLTTAPIYRLLEPSARPFHSSLTQRFGRESDAWQRVAVDKLMEASECFPSLATDPALGKSSVAQWFSAFAALRNKTRGHGADLIAWQAEAAPLLRSSLDTMLNSLECLSAWEWWQIRRNSADVPKVRALANGDLEFPGDIFNYSDGIYVAMGSGARRVDLLSGTADGSDFYLPNGDAQESKNRYEELSYLTGLKRWGKLNEFLRPPRELPISETHGSAELRAVGNVLTNLPETRSDYVRRQALEAELQTVLTDSRHPVVAINGPGGIGKTSLALRVLHELAEEEGFSAILWFSARDIDLDPVRGPLSVKPSGQTLTQFAKQYWNFVEPARLTSGSDQLVADFLDSLTDNDAGPVLYVFDNFETVHNPPQLFREISDFTRLPNKVLITTRHREFKGDWPLDVEGMSRDEFDSLVDQSGLRLGISEVLAAHRGWVTSLFQESGGHPYVVKVALGELARSKKTPQKFERIMASRDEILNALFERSFNRLNPAAQRVFFTLCKWRARIPAIALEAVMTRPSNPRIDVEAALRHLEDSSLIERSYSEVDAESFLHVPAAAYRFGVGSLQFSEMAQSVDEDARFLHMFGAVSDNVTKTGFGAHVHRYYDAAASLAGVDRDQAIAIGEYVARRYPESWVHLAGLQKRAGGQGRFAAKASYQSYLARRPDDADVWLSLASLCAELNDGVGEIRAAANASAQAERRYNGLSSSLLAIRERVESGRLQIDSKQKREHISMLCRGWHSRENQASTGDCFNLGKLAERADNATEALFWAERGLRRERNNQRLLDIRRRAHAIVSGRPN